VHNQFTGIRGSFSPHPPLFAVWVGAGFAASAGLPLVLRHTGPGSTLSGQNTPTSPGTGMSSPSLSLLKDL
jgi:hypothetical protein